RDKNLRSPGAPPIFTPANPHMIPPPHSQHGSVRPNQNIRQAFVGKNPLHLKAAFAQKYLQIALPCGSLSTRCQVHAEHADDKHQFSRDTESNLLHPVCLHLIRFLDTQTHKPSESIFREIPSNADILQMTGSGTTK